MTHRLLLIIAPLVFLVPSLSAQTFKASDGIGCVNGSSCATTTGIAVASNDFVVVVVAHGTTTTCPQAGDTVTDSASLVTFSAASVCSGNSNEGTLEAFIGISTGSNASDKFTASFGASRNSPRVIVLSYTGVGPTSILDKTGTNVGTGGSTTVTVPSPGSITTTAAHELIIECAGGDGSTTTWTAGSIGGTTGTIRKNQLGSGVNFAIGCQDLTVNTVQSAITATMTANASGVDTWGLALTLFGASGSKFVQLQNSKTHA